MRASIKAYNAHHHLPESPTSGYDETTTVAFLRLVDATMRAYGPAMPTPDSEAFCDTHPHLLHRQLLRLFYSPERRMLPAAKFKFVEPDLAPFPLVAAAPDAAPWPASAVSGSKSSNASG